MKSIVVPALAAVAMVLLPDAGLVQPAPSNSATPAARDDTLELPERRAVHGIADARFPIDTRRARRVDSRARPRR